MPALTPHSVVKFQKLAKTAAVSLSAQAVVPTLFMREGIENYVGAAGDTVNVKVRGKLAANEYAWRNDRSNPITFSSRVDRSTPIAFSGHLYSAARLTDEQNDFDNESTKQLILDEARAVADLIENKCIQVVRTAPYNVTLAGAKADGRSLWSTIVKAGEVLSRFKNSTSGRVLLVGPEWSTALLTSDKLIQASSAGDANAASAFDDAMLGKIGGFTIVQSFNLGPNEAYALADGAFMLATASPSVPVGVEGGTATYNGYSVRYLEQYNANELARQSVVDVFAGARNVVDSISGFVGSTNVVSAFDHFIRGVKLNLTATADVVIPDNAALATTAAGELARLTGVSV